MAPAVCYLMGPEPQLCGGSLPPNLFEVIVPSGGSLCGGPSSQPVVTVRNYLQRWIPLQRSKGRVSASANNNTTVSLSGLVEGVPPLLDWALWRLFTVTNTWNATMAAPPGAAWCVWPGRHLSRGVKIQTSSLALCKAHLQFDGLLMAVWPPVAPVWSDQSDLSSNVEISLYPVIPSNTPSSICRTFNGISWLNVHYVLTGSLVCASLANLWFLYS